MGRAKSRAKFAGDNLTAREAAIALLARRDYATGELRARLERQGFGADVVAATLSDLAGQGALDDERYARNYVSYHAGRGQGPLRIAADLRAFGLPKDLIDSVLASGPDWRTAAREVRTRKFGTDAPATRAEWARQARFLQYRGFSADHIRLALGTDFDPD